MDLQHKIQEITGLSDKAYGNIILESGIAYLGYETLYHEEYMEALSYTPEYWDFWLSIVKSRSILFINQFCKSQLTKKELEYIYEALLDVRSLSIYPPDYNWTEGYDKYITNLINKYQKTKKYVNNKVL